MSTVGYTTTPSGSYNYYGININNLLVAKVTMPAAGLITSISCYVAAKNGLGTTTARFCVWDGSGNLLAQTGDITLQEGTGAIGGQSWVTASLTSGYNASNGQVLYIGLWRHAYGTHEWTEDAGSTEYSVTGGDGSNTAPPSSESFTSAGGNPGIYATYSPSASSQAHVYNGSAWVGGTVYVNTGTPGTPVWTAVAGVDVNTGTPGSPVWTPGV